MPKLITIVSVPVGEAPRIIEIEDDLKTMQDLVGGYIEMVSLGSHLGLVCNEDGISLGLPQNGCGILGPFFFTKTDDAGDGVSLGEDECPQVLAYVAQFRAVRHTGTGAFQIPSFQSFDDWLEYRERRKFDAIHEN